MLKRLLNLSYHVWILMAVLVHDLGLSLTQVLSTVALGHFLLQVQCDKHVILLLLWISALFSSVLFCLVRSSYELWGYMGTLFYLTTVACHFSSACLTYKIRMGKERMCISCSALSVGWRKTFLASFFKYGNENLILTIDHWTKTHGPKCVANWKSCKDRTAAILWSNLIDGWELSDKIMSL
jgi:hypothetical protein